MLGRFLITQHKARRRRSALAALLVALVSASASAQTGGGVLESHVVPQERVAAVEAWRRGLPAEHRTVWDQRTGRLLLMAPLETHAELLGLIAGKPVLSEALRGASGPAVKLVSNAEAAPSAEDGPLPPGAFRLSRLTAEELHQRLQALAEKPLPATWNAERTELTFPAGLGEGADVRVRVDATRGVVVIDGPDDAGKAWREVVEAIEASIGAAEDQSVRVVATDTAPEGRVRGAIDSLRVSDRQGGAESGEAGSILGPVQIEFVEGLDVIVLRGDQKDVDRVTSIINQIENLSAETIPAIEVKPLRHASSQSMAELLTRVYAEVLGPRTGSVSITSLGKPNALLLIGRGENVNLALGLIDQLDQPVEPGARFEVFTLKNASAVDAKELLDDFLEQQQGAQDDSSDLRTRAFVVADYRSNTLFVSAAPRDLVELRVLVERLDSARGDAVDEVRVFPLKNALAEDLAEVVLEAINPPEGGDDEGANRPSALRLSAEGDASARLESGVLTGVRVSADTRANALIVTAPADSMPLLAELIGRLDRSPDAAAELKVFTVANGDASSLAEMLRSLFGSDEDDEQAGGYGSGGLSPLSISVDERTNSIIAAGTVDDLAVVEAILLRLDDSDVRRRSNTVFRLRNAQADVVAEVLNEWLDTQREAEEAAELTISPQEQIDREVVVVAELATNSLIVSATPRYEEELRRLIAQLDERPPMVMVQVLIAEVALNDTDEFGVELGLQDSLLFDRSLLSDTQFITTTTNEQSPGGATVSTTTQEIISSDLTPGFNFNNFPLGNNGSTEALRTAGNVAAQGLTNFALGRVNSELDFGGFVLSASSNSLSFLLRALQENRRLEVLSRPQIMTLDGVEAEVLVGSSVPRVSATSLNNFGQTNSIVYEDTGIILRVTPRISPDGQVVMNVFAEKSQLGEEEDGAAISVSASGEILRAPPIDRTRAQTTVSASSGQTIVLSGLLTKRTFDLHRRVPVLADIPLLGDLFRYDGVEETRTELLIILTPRVVRSEVDAEMLKQVESSRMSWVMCDVVDLHGPAGLRTRNDQWGDCEACYPTHVPSPEELGPALNGGRATPVEALPIEAEPTAVEPIGSTPDEASSSEVAPVGYAAPAEPRPRRLPSLFGF